MCVCVHAFTPYPVFSVESVCVRIYTSPIYSRVQPPRREGRVHVHVITYRGHVTTTILVNRFYDSVSTFARRLTPIGSTCSLRKGRLIYDKWIFLFCRLVYASRLIILTSLKLSYWPESCTGPEKQCFSSSSPYIYFDIFPITSGDMLYGVVNIIIILAYITRLSFFTRK